MPCSREIPIVKFTITWNNDDGSLIDTTEVLQERTADPRRPGEGRLFLDGWVPEGGTDAPSRADLPVATGDATYTAQFSAG